MSLHNQGGIIIPAYDGTVLAVLLSELLFPHLPYLLTTTQAINTPAHIQLHVRAPDKASSHWLLILPVSGKEEQFLFALGVRVRGRDPC